MRFDKLVRDEMRTTTTETTGDKIQKLAKTLCDGVAAIPKLRKSAESNPADARRLAAIDKLARAIARDMGVGPADGESTETVIERRITPRLLIRSLPLKQTLP